MQAFGTSATDGESPRRVSVVGAVAVPTHTDSRGRVRLPGLQCDARSDDRGQRAAGDRPPPAGVSDVAGSEPNSVGRRARGAATLRPAQSLMGQRLLGQHPAQLQHGGLLGVEPIDQFLEVSRSLVDLVNEIDSAYRCFVGDQAQQPLARDGGRRQSAAVGDRLDGGELLRVEPDLQHLAAGAVGSADVDVRRDGPVGLVDLGGLDLALFGQRLLELLAHDHSCLSYLRVSVSLEGHALRPHTMPSSSTVMTVTSPPNVVENPIVRTLTPDLLAGSGSSTSASGSASASSAIAGVMLRLAMYSPRSLQSTATPQCITSVLQSASSARRSHSFFGIRLNTSCWACSSRSGSWPPSMSHLRVPHRKVTQAAPTVSVMNAGSGECDCSEVAWLVFVQGEQIECFETEPILAMRRTAAACHRYP